jgi:hypothetical protein
MLIARLTSWLMLVGLLLVGLALPASADDHTLAAKGKYLAQAAVRDDLFVKHHARSRNRDR